MSLFQTIRSSIYNPQFYRELFEKPLKWSIKYFYTFAIFVGVVVTIVLSFEFLPVINSFIEDIGPTLADQYPDELQIKFDKGEVKTNVAEPYAIPVSDKVKSKIGKTNIPEGIENLIVIDTQSSITYESFKNYKTLIFLSKNTVGFLENNGKVTIQPIGNIPDFTITKSNIESWFSLIQSFLGIIPFLFVPALFLGMMAFYSLHLVYLFILALLIWVMFRIKKIDGGYKKAYQIGIHAMTLSFIFEALQMLILPGASFPYFFTLLVIVVAWINLQKPPVAVREPA